MLSNHGLPILSGDSGNKVDYKSDLQFIRNKMIEELKKLKAEAELREEHKQKEIAEIDSIIVDS